MRIQDVRRTYQFLGHKYETEIRLLDPSGSLMPQSIHVENEEEFVEVCAENDGKYNIYVGINERRRGGTKSEDVIKINAIVLDFDSIHPVDMPATSAESYEAYLVAAEAAEYLQDNDKDPYIAMSGNGWQIWLSLDVDLKKHDKKKVERVIKNFHRLIADTFGETDSCNIDNVGDLGRVIKVIGTTSIKPRTHNTRKNRESYWKIIPFAPRVHTEWGKKILRLSKTIPDSLIKPMDVEPEEIPERLRRQYFQAMNEKTIALYKGRWKGRFPSRSEAEMALVARLKEINVPIEHAYTLLCESKIGKWNEATEAYRRLTLRKVYGSEIEER